MFSKPCRVVKLRDVALVERARKGKIYPKDTPYMHLSASDGEIHRLEEQGELTDRSAALLLKNGETPPKYLYYAIDAQIEGFWHTYKHSTINLTPEMIERMEIVWHDNLADREAVCRWLDLLEAEIVETKKAIERVRSIKEYMLDGMFV